MRRLHFAIRPLGGLPARGFVADTGHGELNIHVAVIPNGDHIRAGNAGFWAGDAVAMSCLGRKLGTWIQSITTQFSCRKALLGPLASLDVQLGLRR